MRSVFWLVAIAACGGSGSGDDERDVAREAAKRMPPPEERCDPKKERVCVGNAVIACEDGKLGRGLRTCREGCKDGACVAVCADGNELIYLVDDANNLLTFDPRKLPDDPFHLVGRMGCSSYGSAFSMGVDRQGSAWVVYNTGDLFKVSIADARCQATGFLPRSSGASTFGMGFVTDEPGGKTEKLYVANNDYSRALLTIDTTSGRPTANRVATIEANRGMNPELTGTSEAKLFGFFPSSDEPSFVQEIDRKSGVAIGTRWTLGTTPLGQVAAYAFAQWGGVFYIFTTVNGVSTVRTVDRKTGKYDTAVTNVPYRITGAGVSTCAPELDRPAPRTP